MKCLHDLQLQLKLLIFLLKALNDWDSLISLGRVCHNLIMQQINKALCLINDFLKHFCTDSR